MRKKVLALFLAFVLVVAMLPVSAFAEQYSSDHSQSKEVTEERENTEKGENTEENNDLTEEETGEEPVVEPQSSEETLEENDLAVNGLPFSEQDYAASLEIEGEEELQYFETAQEAWETANAAAYKDQKVEMTLYRDWVADSNLVVEKRTGLLTLDLGGFTVSRNLPNAVQSGEVFTIGKNINFCLTNGSITGGNSLTGGGGIAINGNQDTKLSLAYLSITGNKTQGQGGGISIAGKPEVKIEGCTISDNQSAKEGSGVFVANDSKSKVVLSLSGIVIIDDLILQINNKQAPKLKVDELWLLSAITIGFDQNVEAEFTQAFPSSSAGYISQFFSPSIASATIREKIDQKTNTCTLLLSQRKAVAKVQKKAGETVLEETYYFDSIDEAFNAANQADGDITLTLLEDWTLTTHMIIAKRSLIASALTIDLNGHTVNRKLQGKRETGTGECFIMTQSGNVTIQNGTITGAAHNGYAGAIYAGLSAGTLNLNHLKITGNKCHQSGGAIYVANGLATINISNCEITNNTSSQAPGGGIYVAGSYANVKISDCKITNNSSNYAGGGLYIAGGQNQHANLALSGKVEITNNRSSASEKNLCINLKDDNYVQIDINGLTTGSNIGIAFENGYDRIFTKAVEKNVSDYVQYFHSESDGLTVKSVTVDKKDYLKLDSTGSYEAILMENGNMHYYTDVRKAWNDANSTYLNTSCTITLLKDWVAKDGSLGSEVGFGNERLWPKARDMSNKLTLDLNNYTIDRGLTSYKDYGNVLSVENTLDIEVKNGTIRGGRNHMPGGGVYMKSKGKLTLTNVTITDCKTDKKLLGGGGLFYDGDFGGECIVQGTSDQGTTISGNEVEQISGIIAAWQFPYGGGVYIKGKDRAKTVGYTNFRLIGKVVIKGNRANDSYDNLYIENDAGIRTPELTIGSEVYLGSSTDGSIIKKLRTSYITEWETSIIKPTAQLLFLKSDRGDSMITPHKKDHNQYDLVFRRSV